MILKFKQKLGALILILISISSYCYGLTDQQIKNVQQTIDLLQQKNYQDYLIVKNENDITDQKTKT